MGEENEEVKNEQQEKVEEASAESVEQEDTEQSEDLRQAENSTGIKDAGHNEDAISGVAETQDEQTEEQAEPDIVPSFFVSDEDRIRITVDVLYDKNTGNLVSVSREGVIDPDQFSTFGHTTEWFEFKPVGYEEMSDYRQRCSEFHQNANRMLTNPVKVRNFLIVWHLKDWSLRDRNGNKVELTFNKQGALDDDTINKVYRINPTLLDVVLTLFEKDMMM